MRRRVSVTLGSPFGVRMDYRRSMDSD